MSIVRAPREGNFTIIPNDTLRDARLTFRARGVLSFILSHPDNWVTSAQRLADNAKEGRDAMRKALAELEDTGYLVRRRYRDEGGKWCTDQIIHDTPQTQPEADADPERETSHGGDTDAGSPALETRSYKEDSPQELEEELQPSEDFASPLVSEATPAVEEDKPRQTTAGALLVAKYWKTPTMQSKAVIATFVSSALANGIAEADVIRAITLLSENHCTVNSFSFPEALHGKIVNGPNAGRKGPMEADKVMPDSQYAEGGTHYSVDGHDYWEVEL